MRTARELRAAAVFLMARECEQNPGKSFKTAAVTVMTTLPTSELEYI